MANNSDGFGKTMQSKKSVTIDPNVKFADETTDGQAHGDAKQSSFKKSKTNEVMETKSDEQADSAQGGSPDASKGASKSNKDSRVKQNNMKSTAAIQQELRREHYRNDTNLTDAQKRYESKLWPKHYKP